MFLSFTRLILVVAILLQGIAVNAAESDSGLDPEILSAGIVHHDGYYLPKGLQVPISLNTPN